MYLGLITHEYVAGREVYSVRFLEKVLTLQRVRLHFQPTLPQVTISLLQGCVALALMHPHDVLFHFQIEGPLEVVVVFEVSGTVFLHIVLKIDPARREHEAVAGCLLESVGVLGDVSPAKIIRVEPSHHVINREGKHQDYEQGEQCSQEIATHITVWPKILLSVPLFLLPLSLLLLTILSLVKVEELLLKVTLSEPLMVEPIVLEIRKVIAATLGL